MNTWNIMIKIAFTSLLSGSLVIVFSNSPVILKHKTAMCLFAGSLTLLALVMLSLCEGRVLISPYILGQFIAELAVSITLVIAFSTTQKVLDNLIAFLGQFNQPYELNSSLRELDRNEIDEKEAENSLQLKAWEKWQRGELEGYYELREMIRFGRGLSPALRRAASERFRELQEIYSRNTLTIENIRQEIQQIFNLLLLSHSISDLPELNLVVKTWTGQEMDRYDVDRAYQLCAWRKWEQGDLTGFYELHERVSSDEKLAPILASILERKRQDLQGEVFENPKVKTFIEKIEALLFNSSQLSYSGLGV